MTNSCARANYEKGKLLAEGKTKEIWELLGEEGLVIVQNKDAVTKSDDPSLTRKFNTKGLCATETTCRVFELLNKAGIPVAYQKQISPTEFIAEKCRMIPLEIVARRYAAGSYLKRNPQFERPENMPFRFHRLVSEYFLKTTGGKLAIGAKVLVDNLDPKKGEEDPLVLNPRDRDWTLVHSKKTRWDPEAKLRTGVDGWTVVLNPPEGIIPELYKLLRNTFLVLEGAWSMMGCHFIDLKIECGIDKDGTLRVADVVDNDSWRLRDSTWKELSKEAFRQGEDLTEIKYKYGIVANLIKNFQIPNQALVLWRESEKDNFPELPEKLYLNARRRANQQELSLPGLTAKAVTLSRANPPEFNLPGLTVKPITLSGHKSPQKCLNVLEEILREFPGGGVIVCKVGMSNGLGPILAARTNWPVISIPATINEKPEDIWSSLRMPSNVPMAVVASESNAMDFALRILAQKNPFLYAQIQGQIEELDV
jgi:phosphoribosylaminoimidazole carboxylase/phosphoribosylaminoimidazole-succinocarboxamide synthase